MKRTSRKPRIIPILLLACLCVPLVLRSRYGFDWSDETYYTTLIYRLASGDRLFSQMWELHQLSVIPLVLPARLFLRITGSTDGMILFFRTLYCLFSCVVSICVFCLLRIRYSDEASFIVAAIAQIFVHFSIPNFSYDSMPPLFFILSWSLWAQRNDRADSGASAFFSGVFYALAVQCYPQSLLTVFPVLGMLLFSRRQPSFKKRTTLFLCGCTTIILLFLCFVSIDSSIRAIPDNFGKILADPTHGGTDPVHALLNWGHTILIILGPASWLAAALTVLFLAYRIRFRISKESDSLRVRRVLFGFLALSAVISVLSVCFYRIDLVSKNNFLAFSLLLLMPPALFLRRDLKSDTVWLFGIGLAFSVSAHLFSNMGIYASSFPLILSSIAVILCMDELRAEQISFPSVEKDACPQKDVSGTARRSRVPCILPLAGSAVLLCLLLYTRIFAVHRDEPISELDKRIAAGPAKGVMTTQTSAEKYDEITSMIRTYAPEAGCILITSHLPFGYLVTDLHPAAQSVWNSPFTERLEQWYERNPDRLPDMIVAVESGVGFSNGDGNLEEALQFMLRNGRVFSTVYSSDICRILLTKQQDPS